MATVKNNEAVVEKTWFEEMKDKIEQNTVRTYAETQKALQEKRVAAEKAINVAETKKKELLIAMDAENAVKQKTIIKDKQEEIEDIDLLMKELVYIPPMDKETYHNLAKEIEKHYAGELVDKYSALMELVKQAISIVEEISDKCEEEGDLLIFLGNSADADDNRTIGYYTHHPHSIRTLIKNTFEFSREKNYLIEQIEWELENLSDVIR